MNIVILGVPGAGKGTQAKMLSERLKIPHISTGDIFRNAIKEGTELGKTAADHIEQGKLVPDDVTFGIVKGRIGEKDCKNGFLLDGFPRTMIQAEMLDSLLGETGRKVDIALNIDVPDAEVIDRISGRLVCPSCGANYHKKSNPPLEGGICRECSARVLQRKDDFYETVVKRIETYHLQTKPLISHYSDKGVIVTVNGTGDITGIHDRIMSEVRGHTR
ncbi:MAG: adenylate kinase [Eubacteriales bacterium]|nr:adenylate kinase [Eubacteriales bacterium]